MGQDFMGKAICLAKSGSRSKEIEAASASRNLDTSLPRLEVDIQDIGSAGGPNSNLVELQRDLTILPTKYELLQQEAFQSNKDCKKLEQERAKWVLERALLKEKFEMLKSSEVQIQRLHGDEKNKCIALAEQLVIVKEVQNELQVQKERSDKFMSFVDKKTNKMDICKVVWELEQLQQQINEQDVDQVIDSVLNDILNNDLTETEPRLSGPEVSNPRWFGVTLVGGQYENLPKSDCLSLPNFPTQYYMPLSEVAQLVVSMPHSQDLLAIVLNQSACD
jgi:hypothetical protein